MLYDMLVATTKQHPNKIAIHAESGELSFSALLTQVNGFADDLLAQGIKPGAPVMLMLPNGPEFAVAVFASAKVGAIIAPLNTAVESTELAYYLQDSQPQVLIGTQALVARHHELIAKHVPDCQVVTRVPLTEADTSETGECATVVESDSITPDPVAPDGIVLYQYSSGSTGKPKRVMRSHANLVHEANSYVATADVTPEDCILCVVPMFHAHGFGNGLLAAVCAGATLVIQAAFNRERVMAALIEQRITIFPGVPFIFSILADSSSIEPVRLADLRLAFTAGAPLSHKIFSAFHEKFGVQLRQLYGSTETGSIAVNLGSVDGERWASVGKAMQDVEISIIGEAGQTKPADEVGEIVVRSAAMTAGYAGLPEVNQETFRDGCFWSGDLGRLDTEGNLFITGRKKLFINVGANKVDPGEVEAVLNTHPAIQESVVLGTPGAYGDEVVKAVLVANSELAVEPEAVKAWLRDKIAGFKVPRVIEFRDEIPRSPLGKILRKNLQD